MTPVTPPYLVSRDPIEEAQKGLTAHLPAHGAKASHESIGLGSFEITENQFRVEESPGHAVDPFSLQWDLFSTRRALFLPGVLPASCEKTVDQGIRAKVSIGAEAIRHGNILFLVFAPGAHVGSPKGRKGINGAERAVLPAIDLGVQRGLWIGRGAQNKIHAEHIQVPALFDQGKLPCARTRELLVFPKGTSIPAEHG